VKIESLDSMLLFLSVVEAGSFKAASELLNIPRASLSRKISQLEEELNVTLIERTTRSQSLTEAGQLYLNHCEKIRKEVESAELSLANFNNDTSGALKMGAPVGVGHELLKNILGEFISLNPNIDLHLSLDNKRVDITSSDLDILVRIGKLDDSALIGRKLGVIRKIIIASPKYLEKVGEITYVDKLAEVDVLLMAALFKNKKLKLESNNEIKRLSIKPKLLINDFTVVKKFALDGYGVALIPEYMCRKECESGELVEILSDWECPPVEVFAVYPRFKGSLPKIKLLVDFLIKKFNEIL